MKRQKGNVGDVLTMGILVLALTVVMTSFIRCMALLQDKSDIRGCARDYILRMETVGFLNGTDRRELIEELGEIGLEEISLDGTTMNEVPYGAPVTLCIGGRLEGEYEVREIRTSTAKY